MASNYPPGVTGNEPQIAGEPPHYRQCPAHEDKVNAHDCGAKRAKVEYFDSPPYRSQWVFTLFSGFGPPISAPIEFCPYCGVELVTVETVGPCACEEICEGLREQALEDKEEARNA